MLCVCDCDCLFVSLFAGSSLVAPLPWLISRSGLKAASTTTIIIIIVTTTQVGKPFRTIDPLRILGYL